MTLFTSLVFVFVYITIVSEAAQSDHDDWEYRDFISDPVSAIRRIHGKAAISKIDREAKKICAVLVSECGADCDADFDTLVNGLKKIFREEVEVVDYDVCVHYSIDVAVDEGIISPVPYDICWENIERILDKKHLKFQEHSDGYEKFFDDNFNYRAMRIQLFSNPGLRSDSEKYGFAQADHAILIEKVKNGFVVYQSFFEKYPICAWMTQSSGYGDEFARCADRYGRGKPLLKIEAKSFLDQVNLFVQLSQNGTSHLQRVREKLGAHIFGVKGVKPMKHPLWTFYK